MSASVVNNIGSYINVKVQLEDKVLHFDEDQEDSVPEEEEADEDEEEKLYYIETKKNFGLQNKIEGEKLDFHQRKAKEIRRLQYASKLGEVKSPKKKVTIVYYSVWALKNGKPVPSRLRSETGSMTHPDAGTLLINEDDNVTVKPKDNSVLSNFGGRISKPLSGEPDCDFIVETNDGQRIPILVTLRPEKPKTRVVPGANSTMFNLNDERLGRAKALLVGKDSKTGDPVEYAKGILLDSNNDLSIVLLKRLNKQECFVKKDNGKQRLEIIEREEDAEMDGMKARRLILKKDASDQSPFERELYLYANNFFLQPMKIFDNEFVAAECENMKDYNGKLEHVQNGDEENLYVLSKNQNGLEERNRIVLDDAYGRKDIADQMDWLNAWAKKRYQDYLDSLKKRRNQLDIGEIKFDIVDTKGRKMKVTIRNDSDNEAFSESEDEGEDLAPETSYYHLVLDNKKVLPCSRKQKSAHNDVSKTGQPVTGYAAKDGQRVSPLKTKQGSGAKGQTVVEYGGIKATNILDKNKDLVTFTYWKDDVKINKLPSNVESLRSSFNNDKLFISFLQFFDSLPEGTDENRAADLFREMNQKVLRK